MVNFYLPKLKPQGAAPLVLENVVGRDAERPYWTVSGEVEICREIIQCKKDEVGDKT